MMQWPADRVERRAVGELLPYAQNPRTHDAAQVAAIAASMKEFGWTVPVLTDEAGVLITGHGRVMAAKLLGLGDVPVMVARGWSEAQKRAYRIADNQLSLTSGWDVDLLKVELSDLNVSGYALNVLGFPEVDLREYLAPPVLEGDPDAMVDPQDVVITQPGDLWVLGDHRLLCGDATERADVELLLGGEKPHLMVTDPPYGVNYDPAWRNGAVQSFKNTRRTIGKVDNDDRADWSSAWVLFPGNVAYIWHSGTMAHIVAGTLNAAGFEIRAQIVWAKQHFAISRGDYHPMHEPCWYVVRKGAGGYWQGDRTQTTLWHITSLSPVGNKGGRDLVKDAKTGHSTQKPIECMKRPIENNSARGDAVYDPFVGGGTSVIAAEMTGRRCYALEIEPRYVDVSVRRWQQFTGKRAVLARTGESFDVRDERA